LIIKR